MLLKKITSSLATSGALLVLATGAVFASTDVTISGNGEDSVNTVKVNLTNTTSVYQSNATNVKNHVSSSASTGSNVISKTTNGNAKIDTGDATSMV
ncbi:MAG: hypothetical protein NZM26_04855, partial [Patescibacteria group bacterium]|nr:hypothetical protein [Patescibacteria group bacterium]